MQSVLRCFPVHRKTVRMIENRSPSASFSFAGRSNRSKTFARKRKSEQLVVRMKNTGYEFIAFISIVRSGNDDTTWHYSLEDVWNSSSE
mmetsp:Transcript_14729/g.34213  ORF Transcript_14729/g.34213 Transcript_14729/m.34213 type:complete len:89 (+) Transcript_14729:353-619(+)